MKASQVSTRIALQGVFPKKFFAETQREQKILDAQLSRHLKRDSDYELQISCNTHFGILYVDLEIVGNEIDHDLVCAICEQDLDNHLGDVVSVQYLFDPEEKFTCAICGKTYKGTN